MKTLVLVAASLLLICNASVWAKPPDDKLSNRVADLESENETQQFQIDDNEERIVDNEERIVENGDDIELLFGADTQQVSFYLSASAVNGANVLDHCADGYHFASAVELQNLSPLVYNTTLGATGLPLDWGEGPPMDYEGWIRTGFSESGQVGNEWNCSGWDSSDPNHDGVAASFEFDTTLNAGVELKFQKIACSVLVWVWCISDAAY